MDGVVGSACALMASAASARGSMSLVLTANTADAEHLRDDLSLFTSTPVERFPSWQTHISDALVYDTTYGERLRILKAWQRDALPRLVVAAVPAVLQPVPRPETVIQHTRHLVVGDTLAQDGLVSWLVDRGFHVTSGVELPGELARRGGIVDLFAADWERPVRVEWEGDEIASLREFDLGTQRSTRTLNSLEVTVFPRDGDDPMRAAGASRGTVLDYLKEECWITLVEPDQIRLQAQHYVERLPDSTPVHTWTQFARGLARFGCLELTAFAAQRFPDAYDLQSESVERLRGGLDQVRQELDQVAVESDAILTCPTSAEADRLQELLADTAVARDGRLHPCLGNLHRGFHLPRERVLVLSATECLVREDVRRVRRRHLGKQIDSFVELREGELVIHLGHGIGRYRGLEVLRRESQVEEHLVIEFAGGTRVYVPSTRISLVQKYVGGKNARPRLATLGGTLWNQRRKAAEAAVRDLAGELLEVHAQR
ncbi:MAG TPA: CarD family transcriptional regulator, partial [Pirellulaceae bacterium]